MAFLITKYYLKEKREKITNKTNGYLFTVVFCCT